MTEGVAMGEVDEVQDRVMEIAALLKKKAPHLAPSVIPRPYKHAAANMVTLCSTPRQRADIEAFLVSKAESAAADDVAAAGKRSRGEEGQQIESEDAVEGGKHHVVLETDTNIATRTFRITAAKLGGRIDATLSDLNLLMDLHLNAPRQELAPYVERFAAANELDPSTAALALHGACSLAYALQVATSIAGWNGFVGSHPLPLADDVDMTVVMRELFRPPPTPPASPRSRSKSKTKGKKGGAKKKKAGAAAAATAAAAGGESGAAGVEGVVSGKGKTAKKGSKRKKQG